MNPHKLTIGQNLWFIAINHTDHARGGTWISIQKIGRRWAETSNGGRIDLETLKADPSRYPQGQAYLSKEKYDVETRTESAWRAFAREFNSKFHAPVGVTIDDIAEAARLLGLPLEKRT